MLFARRLWQCNLRFVGRGMGGLAQVCLREAAFGVEGAVDYRLCPKSSFFFRERIKATSNATVASTSARSAVSTGECM